MWKMNQELPPNEAYVWTKDIFTEDELDLIIRIGKNLNQIDGGVNQSGVAALETRRSKIAWIKPGFETDFIFMKLTDAIKRLNDIYYKYDLTEMEDIQFSEYDESYQGMYRNHTDDGFEAYQRKLSFSLQLTNSDEYDGGDLAIYRFRLDSPFHARRDRGFLTVFNSSTIHEVTPVTRGTRYSLVGWAHGPRFK
jgi:PKHD-type hydroxylase